MNSRTPHTLMACIVINKLESVSYEKTQSCKNIGSQMKGHTVLCFVTILKNK